MNHFGFVVVVVSRPKSAGRGRAASVRRAAGARPPSSRRGSVGGGEGFSGRGPVFGWLVPSSSSEARRERVMTKVDLCAVTMFLLRTIIFRLIGPGEKEPVDGRFFFAHAVSLAF